MVLQDRPVPSGAGSARNQVLNQVLDGLVAPGAQMQKCLAPGWRFSSRKSAKIVPLQLGPEALKEGVGHDEVDADIPSPRREMACSMCRFISSRSPVCSWTRRPWRVWVMLPETTTIISTKLCPCSGTPQSACGCASQWGPPRASAAAGGKPGPARRCTGSGPRRSRPPGCAAPRG